MKKRLTVCVLYVCLQGILAGCNSMCAGYLFQPDKQYDVTYDTGDKAIQCGRHVDIFKFWLMWKAKVRHRETNTHIHTYIGENWSFEAYKMKPVLWCYHCRHCSFILNAFY